MRTLALIFVIASPMVSMGQHQLGEMRSILGRKTLVRIANTLSEGEPIFYVFQRQCDDLFLTEESDSCEHRNFEDVVFVPEQKTAQARMIVFDNCGKVSDTVTSCSALKFYQKRKDAIRSGVIVYNVMISHTCIYRFVEVNNSEIVTHLELLPEAIERDPNEENRVRQMQTMTWKFFFLLWDEINSINKSP